MANSTINYYNEHAKSYYETTVGLDMGRLYQPFIDCLRPGAKVLDAGCGSGRDSLFFKNQGFQVTAFDASEELVKLSSRLLGQEVLLMSFENLQLPEQYDGIWACASLLHVKRSELPGVIAKLTEHLKPDGVFYLSFKYGDEEVWKGGRYFNYLHHQSFQEVLRQIPQLKLENLFITVDVRQDRDDERWLNAYLVKL